jgi:hypothetical protein
VDVCKPLSAGPIALLGGLETNPLKLVTHFFAVAVFGVARLMAPLPTPAGADTRPPLSSISAVSVIEATASVHFSAQSETFLPRRSLIIAHKSAHVKPKSGRL